MSDRGGMAFAVGSLWSRLREAPEGRHTRGVRYPRDALLVPLTLARLAGTDHPSAIAAWVANRQEALLAALGVSWSRVPHHTTDRRIRAQVIDPAEPDGVVGAFVTRLPQTGTRAVGVIAGKTMRGTIASAIHTASTSWPPICRRTGSSGCRSPRGRRRARSRLRRSC